MGKIVYFQYDHGFSAMKYIKTDMRPTTLEIENDFKDALSNVHN